MSFLIALYRSTVQALQALQAVQAVQLFFMLCATRSTKGVSFLIALYMTS